MRPTTTHSSNQSMPNVELAIMTSRRSRRQNPLAALIANARSKRQAAVDEKFAALRSIINSQNLVDLPGKRGKTLSAQALVDAMWMEGKPSTGAVRAYYDALKNLQHFDTVITPKLWVELAKLPPTHPVFCSSPPARASELSSDEGTVLNPSEEENGSTSSQDIVVQPEQIDQDLDVQIHPPTPSRPAKRTHETFPDNSQSPETYCKPERNAPSTRATSLVRSLTVSMLESSDRPSKKARLVVNAVSNQRPVRRSPRR